MRKAEPAPVAPPETRPAEAELRASDADREKIAELLRDAYAEGRLTVDEHAERIEAAYSAKTLGELAPLTRDLPTHQPIAPGAERPQPAAGRQLPPAREEPANLVAVFGGSARKGRWRVGSHIRATAVFGGVELDLTDAVFESPEVLIEVSAVFGGVSIRVPENVTLVGSGVGIFGGFEVREQTAPDPYAPVVRVKGAAVFGGCDAKPRRGTKVKEWVRKQLDG
ncbi:DUF1707 domain-containing protein [Kitasatospora sp. GAS204B]|uniref:DUF1707 SHOCT-like domain-containing protein n=1 Tax=Kitasatospora sp. GAS204B TaxID=3035283 RepID=UPI002473C783|nr:DUF1707 domain-containing protein [Kitasatospora sp. GAS204B]